EYPFVDGQSIFLNQDELEIDLSTHSNGIAADSISFGFTGETKLIKKLQKLKDIKWELIFYDYSGSSWVDQMYPKDARRFIALMMNFAYMWVSDDYQKEFLNEYLTTHNGETVLTTEEKQQAITDLMNKDFYECGKVSSAAGLGGDTTIGFAEYILRDIFYYDDDTADISSHELMHTIGFGHDSNLTYPLTVDGVETGINPVTRRISKKFFDENRWIVTPENYYYKSDIEQEAPSEENTKTLQSQRKVISL
ncbi:MAG: hypothetical protein ACK5MI_10175, partial [Mangrovibacterium sp.]